MYLVYIPNNTTICHAFPIPCPLPVPRPAPRHHQRTEKKTKSVVSEESMELMEGRVCEDVVRGDYGTTRVPCAR